MLFSTIGQIHVFIWMMAAGVLIGLWYACLAALRRLLCAGFWLTLAADAVFGAGAAGIFILALVTANYGQVRFFAVLGALTGCALFGLGVYPPMRRIVENIVRAICRLFIKIRQLRWITVIFR